MPDGILQGRVAVITGGSRGLGKAMALALAEAGASLALVARDAEALGAVKTEALACGAGAAECYRIDVTDEQQVRQLEREVIARFGAVHILINNAGINIRKPMADLLEEDWDAVMDVSVKGSFLCSQRFMPAMVERGWGRVVNVTSGIADQPELIAYAISKAAVDKFVYDTVGKLEGTGVLMNLLDPGWLRTDLGGPNAPNSVESVLPGALMPVLIDDKTTGTLFRAQDYAGTEL